MKRLLKKAYKAYFQVLGYYPASIRGFTFKLDPFHIEFWRSAEKDIWEPETFKIMSRFISADSVYCDIGSWIGPTVIFAAKISKKVICFEPDPYAYKYLLWNIHLNELHNVTSYSIAISDQTSTMRMSSVGGNLGDSTTSLLNNSHESNTVDVLALQWNEFINLSKTEKIDFLKIDIEGGEFALLPAMRDYLSLHKPIVYLSIHTPFLDVGLRREKMQQVIEVMKIYKNCLDQNLRPIDISELNSEDALANFRSYIFMD
jgi:FkbM family methyltransferase